MIGVLLGLYLASSGLDARAIGLVVSAGLAGAAVSTFVVTFFPGRTSLRISLLLLALFSIAGGALLIVASGTWVFAVAAFIGMVNGMGRDRGASLVIEQAALPATVGDARRTFAFAKYNILQDVGHAGGALLAAVPALLQQFAGIGPAPALRASLSVYLALLAVPVLASLRLSPAIEGPRTPRHARLTDASRGILWKISSLFALDSVAGGFLTTALLAYFFHERFGAGAEVVAPLFFGARVLNAVSHVGAAWLARRIGLVNTMVFTHIPSSLLLLTVPFAPNFETAAVLFLLREGLVEMDVPTRQSYVMAVVRSEERLFASGITHLVRMAGWAIAPAVAGLLMSGSSLATPIIVGAAMKIAYDLLLWRAFRGVRPPEEKA
jgi:MFS family permease